MKRRHPAIALSTTAVLTASLLAAGVISGGPAAFAAETVTISGNAYAGSLPRAWDLNANPTVSIAPSTVIQPGLSIENVTLKTPGWFYSTNAAATRPTSRLPDLMKFLRGNNSQGAVLRIGGNTAENTVWGTDYDGNALTQVDKLADYSGFDVVLSTSLSQNNAARSTSMIGSARSRISSLKAAQFGNEPDHFDPHTDADLKKYIANWDTYLGSLRSSGANLPVWGPDAATKPTDGSWTYFNFFLQDQLARKSAGSSTVGAVAIHKYAFNSDGKHTRSAADNLAHIQSLLSNEKYVSLKNQALRAADAGRMLGVPAVLSERNSVAIGGEAGVSDSFGAALWALDSTLLAARSGISRQNLHSSLNVCGRFKNNNSYYSPFCAADDASAAKGLFRAQSEYFGLLAASTVGNGTFLDTGGYDNTTKSLHSYAVRNADGTITLVLINLAAGAQSATLNLPTGYTVAKRADLTTSDTDPTARVTNTNPHTMSLGNHSVIYAGSTGAASWAGADFTPTAMSGTSWTGSVPGYSAALIRFSTH